MQANEQIERFKNFYEEYYQTKIIHNIDKENKRLNIDFKHLNKHDTELAQLLLEQPEEILKAGEVALQSFNEKAQGFKVRVKNIPPSNMVRIMDLRSEHFGKLIMVEGIVNRKSDVRPKITLIRYECPSCGGVINIPQLKPSIKEPTKCSCGRKGKFRVLSKELINGYSLRIEEIPEKKEYGSKLSMLNLFLSHDLTDRDIEEKIYEGLRIKITGTLKEVAKFLRSGAQSSTLDWFFDVNYVQMLDDYFLDIKITKDEEERIKKFAKDKPLERLAKMAFASIYGYDAEKEVLLLQLIEGITDMEKVPLKRGKIHIFIVGNPSTGKTALMNVMEKIAPKERRIIGDATSGAGLRGSVVKDELISGGFTHEAGALALGDNGIILFDELDKIPKEDRNALHSPMEDMKVIITKAAKRTMLSRVSIFAGANPIHGVFEKGFSTIYNQVNLPASLINRFDFIFVFRGELDEEQEKNKAKLMLTRYDDDFPKLDREFIIKYIIYSKKLNPVMSKKLKTEYVPNKYVELKNKSTSGDEAINVFPITPRHLNTIVRVAEARAKVHLRENVLEEDVDYVIEKLYYSLTQFGLDPVTGKIDESLVSTGISSSQRNMFRLIKETYKKLSDEKGDVVEIQELVDCIVERGFSEDAVEEGIGKLSRNGEFFEPRRGFLKEV